MRTLKEKILTNWQFDIMSNALPVDELAGTEYPAWTIKLADCYGVAIPYDREDDINESFANAHIKSRAVSVSDKTPKRMLTLTTTSESGREAFALLCAAFVDPGENGQDRLKIQVSPLSWWKEWKELVGNKNVDEMIYDTLGELCGLLYALQQGEDAQWNGPDGASYDIETEKRFLEIKSTVNRDGKEITISNQFQLFPEDKPLELILCVFEPVNRSGISINKLLDKIAETGYNTDIINAKLEKKGFEKNMSSRKREYLLHEMLLYKIDDSFPRITPASFKDDVLPQGILKISYTVDLSGITPTSLFRKETNDG